jgi:hypothetical protein
LVRERRRRKKRAKRLVARIPELLVKQNAPPVSRRPRIPPALTLKDLWTRKAHIYLHPDTYMAIRHSSHPWPERVLARGGNWKANEENV